jgi:hypothetical protein
MHAALARVLEKAAREHARVHQQQRVRPQVVEQVVRRMHFGDIVAAELEFDDGMTATLGQQHRASLRIGSFAVLIAAAAKGGLIGWRIGRMEERAIDRHQPIASIKGAGHRLRLRQHLTALVQQRTLSHSPRFARPGLTLSHTTLDDLSGGDPLEQAQIDLFTHLVIDVHFA